MLAARRKKKREDKNLRKRERSPGCQQDPAGALPWAEYPDCSIAAAVLSVVCLSVRQQLCYRRRGAQFFAAPSALRRQLAPSRYAGPFVALPAA